MSIRVLVACEESQTVCKAFLARGFDAYSCDLKDCSGGLPERHIKGDCFEAILSQHWDCVIAHPPCTYLAVCGNRWLRDNSERWKARQDALAFFARFLALDTKFLAIENPIGVASSVFRQPDQIIEPWQFGESFSKKTCLWLRGLPRLKPTNIVGKGETVVFPSGRRMPKWYADLWSLCPEERSTMRSKTFPGIADAMAEQWGNFMLSGGYVERFYQCSLLEEF